MSPALALLTGRARTSCPMIEVKQLLIFRTIVELGSFTAAGEHLRMSQPAISQQMRALEASLGVSLLLRAGRGARPTPAGETLLPYARLVLEKIHEVAHRLAEERAGCAGVVRIGTPEPACNYLLPPVLSLLRARLPRLDVRVTSGHTATTLARLAAGDVDVSLLPLPVDGGRLRIVEVGRDELVAIVAPGHAWAGRATVAPAAFAGEPMILYDRQSQITDLTLQMLLEAGVFPRIALEIDHLEAMKDLVRDGMGVAVIPRWAARRELAAGALAAVQIGDRGLLRTWGIVYADERPQPGSLRSVIAVLREALSARLAVV